MKLYYSPFACSLAAHIACREAGLELELVRVDLPTKRLASGGDLFAVNPMAQVPALVLPNGRVLTECVAVLAYIEHVLGKSDSIGAPGSSSSEASDPYELLRWLSFVATEIHKRVLWPIFAPTSPESVKEYARQSASLGLGVVSARLESGDGLLGDHFSVADAYLFWAVTLLPHAGVPLDSHPVLRRYYEQHRQRPAIRAALRYEKQQLETPFPGT